MKILVANIGSTSFKYRLYDMPAETMLARGGVERIGSEHARSFVMAKDRTVEEFRSVANHMDAVQTCFDQLIDSTIGVIDSPNDIAAIGFKAVHAKDVSGVQLVDDMVLSAMDAFNHVAPAHNPPYSSAMRQLQSKFPKLKLVAAFETGFHQTTEPAHQYYAIPFDLAQKHGIKRYGFHGASHRYIAGRMSELTGRRDLRIISCHLGGSSSITAIAGQKSLGNSLGMSPQSGLPHNNRVGDFDIFALSLLVKEEQKTLDEMLGILSSKGGLLGLSGVSNDVRDIEEAARTGNERAKLALDVFVGSIRDYIGSYLVRLGGCDALVFTGGIGENSTTIRAATCQGLEELGFVLDSTRNASAKGEQLISRTNSKTAIWTVPTNEELVVARQTYERLSA